jgi:hypothetical protein
VAAADSAIEYSDAKGGLCRWHLVFEFRRVVDRAWRCEKDFAGSWVVGMVIYGLPRRRAGRLEHEMAVRLRILILACW